MKPRTADAHSKRQKRPLVGGEQRGHGSMGVTGMVAGPPNVHISGYRNNMNNIQMLSNHAKVTNL